jgi:hypothetical protein
VGAAAVGAASGRNAANPGLTTAAWCFGDRSWAQGQHTGSLQLLQVSNVALAWSSCEVRR